MSAREKKAELPSSGNLSKEKKRLTALADCKSLSYEGLWVSSCLHSVEKYLLLAEINVQKKTQRPDEFDQRLIKIVKCLSASPAKMMTVEELTDAIVIVTYDKALMFRKHLKRSLLTGKNAIPVYIKDPPTGTSPSLKKELTLVILKHDSGESTLAKAVRRQKEIVEKYSRHT